jgi:hypothetical protein
LQYATNLGWKFTLHGLAALLCEIDALKGVTASFGESIPEIES